MKIDGACHCGNLRFEARVDPDSVFICHCSDCQTLSGSAYRTVVPAIDGSFRFTAGTPKIYVKTADGGDLRAQAFCPECGTPIYSGPVDGKPGFFGLRVGAIRQRAQLTPGSQYWCRSAQDWVQDIRTLPRTDTQ